MDDGICASSDRQQCDVDTQQIVNDVTLAGFIINTEKSSLEPQQVGPWLGFLFDLNKGMFYVPEEKLARQKTAIVAILNCKLASVHKLASIVGQKYS